jgi:RsiW-degrading membrane proteinase PrsW (M82 family)
MWGLMGAIAVLMLIAVFATGGSGGFLTAIALALLPVPVYVLIILRLDRFEPEPPRLMGWAFFWGATIATFLAGIANELGGAYLANWLGETGPDAQMAVAAVLVAPFVEEVLKGAALLALALRKRDEFDGPVDGIVYGALVGLGFAMTENALYYVEAFVEGGAGGATGLFLLRGVFTGFSHPLYTSLTGIGIGLALARKGGGPLRVALPLGGLAAGITLHHLWNYSAMAAEATGGASVVSIYFGLMLPVLAVWLWFAVRSLRAEGRLIAEHLAPDVAAGVLAGHLHAELGTLRGRAAAVQAAMRQGGVAAMRARRAFHRAASDEGLRRWRATLGREADAAHRHDYLHPLGLPMAPPTAMAAPPPPPAPPPAALSPGGPPPLPPGRPS